MTPNTPIAIAAMAILSAPSAHASLIINEIDYDQPGADDAEFIELYNPTNASLDLEGYSIALINGFNSSTYRTIDLSGFSLGAEDYFVVCNDSGTVANCDHPFTTSSSWIQNGAPDGVALYDDGALIDSMTYEGEISGFTEGSTLFLEDSNADIMSLARIPDGNDTDNNFSDFKTACITPGTANIAGTGDCTNVATSPVPVPAAVWLFASGLLGLTSIARRMR